MTTLTDGTLRLRAPTAADAAAVAEAVRASFEELDRWMPWASPDYDESAAMFWIESNETSFLIVDEAESVVGTCGLNGFDELNKRANLGYWVRTGHTGRGIATAATILVAAHGLTDLALQRLEIVMSVHNEPSRRVAERSGATYEGVLRSRLWLKGTAHDAHSFSITSPEQLPDAMQ